MSGLSEKNKNTESIMRVNNKILLYANSTRVEWPSKTDLLWLSNQL